MNTQDSGGSAAGRETAPEGKDPNGPGPGDVAAEGKDGWEGGGGDEGGGGRRRPGTIRWGAR